MILMLIKKVTASVIYDYMAGHILCKVHPCLCVPFMIHYDLKDHDVELTSPDYLLSLESRRLLPSLIQILLFSELSILTDSPFFSLSRLQWATQAMQKW
jgi:hypothetical protein